MTVPGELDLRRTPPRASRRATSPTSTPAERRAAVAELGERPFRAGQLSRALLRPPRRRPRDDDRPPRGVARSGWPRRCCRTLLTPVRAPRRPTTAGPARRSGGCSTAPPVESVLMRYPSRVTMCVSSQAGCGMNCPFCATGQAGLTRNLSTAEIVDQVVAGARMLAPGRDRRRAGPRSRTSSSWAWASRWPTTSAVIGAVRRLTDPAPGRSRACPQRNITVSTVGPGARDGPARRRGPAGDAWRCRCTHPTTSCATRWCRSTPGGRSPRCSTPARRYSDAHRPPGVASSTP